MAIQKLPRKKGNVYRVSLYDSLGTRVTRCFDRRIDAEKWEDEMSLKIRNNELEKEENINFEEFADLFVKTHAQANMSYTGCERYESALRLYATPYFKGKKLNAIRRIHLEEFKATLAGKKSASTIFTILKTVLNKAVEWNYLKSSPAAHVRPPKRVPPREDYWTEEEVQKFLNSMKCNARYPLYMIALNTGMRAGEIFGLKWDCVDFEGGWIYVRRSFCQKTNVIRDTTKTNHYRSIPMTNGLKKLLLELKIKSQDDRVIVPEEMQCSDVTHTAKVLRRDANAVGVRPIKFHELRATYASLYVAKGGNIYEVSKILGHKDVSMTQKYARFAPEYRDRMADVLSFEAKDVGKVIHLTHKSHTAA